MGSRERKIVEVAGIDLKELIKLLNKAYSDEWLAHYQYWVGAKVAEGMIHDVVSKELEEHAKEELDHADKLADRIIQLGGEPILEPKEWYTMSNCKYAPPKDHDLRTILKQNIEGEHCAMGVYQQLMKFTFGKDHVTYKIALEIYEEEVEHEEDLEAIMRDIVVSRKWK